MLHVNYSFLRALEFTGRHPHDTGEWLVTNNRVLHSEGEPHPNDPAFRLEFGDDEPYPPAPKLPVARTWPQRSLLYRRLFKSGDCRRYMHRTNGGFQSCFYLYSSWVNPEYGVITMPGPEEKPFDQTHCVAVMKDIPEYGLFNFRNPWPNWGHNGQGAMPYEYFDKYSFEAWAKYDNPRFETHRIKAERTHRFVRWTFRDEGGNRIYGFQVLHPRTDERWAWAFVIETGISLEIQELYVHPDHRRRGLGTLLAEGIAALMMGKRMRLVAMVPFADTEREAPGTFPALVSVLRKLDIRFSKSPISSVGYFGIQGMDGSEIPVEPDFIPARPTSTLEKLQAALVAASILLGSQNLPPTIVAHRDVVASAAAYFDSDEWAILNVRRGELISRKNGGELTAEEAVELEGLQRKSLSALDKDFPGPPLNEAELDAIELRLRQVGGNG